ncbi:MAG: alpha-L-fucosidase, partial [Clostridia bacterium]|nr:alpha-L-fucosidase [Clostridia bacterium]
MSSYKTVKTPGNTEWFTHDRFGMFIHFGLYSMAARHEWIMNYESITEEKYRKYFEHFNPDLFDAKEWAKAAKNAGMKYVILTTKH